eukprot:COSAG04_NODE_691_length_11104_cov_6.949841_8_plen_311_part_00
MSSRNSWQPPARAPPSLTLLTRPRALRHDMRMHDRSRRAWLRPFAALGKADSALLALFCARLAGVMSSVPTTVDVERGTPLEGLSLTREQQLELYRSGVRSLFPSLSACSGARCSSALCCCAQFVVLKNVVSKELTAAAKAHMAADVAGEFGANATGRTCPSVCSGSSPLQPLFCSARSRPPLPNRSHPLARPAENPIGSEPAILDLINASKFRPVLQSLIGDFDEPSATQVAVTPPGTDYISGKLDGQEGFNSCGYREEGFPYYNAIVHMDGLSVSDSPQHVCTGTKEQIYLDYIVSACTESILFASEV